jgi:hypothetical protein
LSSLLSKQGYTPEIVVLKGPVNMLLPAGTDVWDVSASAARRQTQSANGSSAVLFISFNFLAQSTEKQA